MRHLPLLLIASSVLACNDGNVEGITKDRVDALSVRLLAIEPKLALLSDKVEKLSSPASLRAPDGCVFLQQRGPKPALYQFWCPNGLPDGVTVSPAVPLAEKADAATPAPK